MVDYQMGLTRLKVLYDHAEPLHTLKKTTNEYQQAFDKLSKNHPNSVLVSTEKHLRWIPHLDPLISFFQRNSLFWLLPLTTVDSSEIFGYYFRSVNRKEFRVFLRRGVIQSLFGWASFFDYTPGKPISLTEGVKELAVLQETLSLHTLALLSLTLTEPTLYFLSKLTRVLYLAFDNDTAGQKAVTRITSRASKYGIVCYPFLPRKKDWGSYLSCLPVAQMEIQCLCQQYNF